MNQIDPKIVETYTPLPESKLWGIQRRYFQHKGISAWDKDVPSYISSNAFIGHLYAEQCIAFIQDWCRQNPQNNEFYLLEIASGTGQFAFHFLAAMNALLKAHHLEHIQLHFIISDVTEQNIDFCENNPVLKPFIDANQLDFAHFDAETDTDILLKCQQKNLSTLMNQSPLIIIANYAFDFIQQDLLVFTPNTVERMLLGIKSRFDNYDVQKSDYINELQLDFKPEVIDSQNYYTDPDLKALLDVYLDAYKDKNATVFMPLGVMQTFKVLDTLSKGRYFAIVADKGVTTLDEIITQSQNNYYTYDGIYTFDVNFHAIETYIKRYQGDALLSNQPDKFKINCFFKGIDKSALHNTQIVFQYQMEKITPENFCYVFNDFFAYSYRFDFGSLIAFLRLSQWDPIAYVAIHARCVELLPTLTPISKKSFINDLKAVEARCYPVKSNERAYLFLGDIYDKLNEPVMAIAVYQRALTFFEKNKDLQLQTALLFEKYNNPSKAITHFQIVLDKDPHNRIARKQMQKLTGIVSMTSIRPYVRAIFVFLCLGASFYLLMK